ncbi:LLM class flavin-dependent oxidoreductase [Ktedonobacter robiniae]|uniref:Luciferase-like domain-containing protein n=1 Tax=Ktedonobacter robiniae TaxID=2778365 RepID=A0ABQ3V6C8_9CHLR|nr:LLM class flavin-dependent oxidoreductase [Ktedonobacter robiniae]GHO60435.1 hypothetical protein KSB_89100 [Ktedonobacter robiniae]
MSRAFRFGVLSGGIPSRSEWIMKARQAEDLGYATLLVPDHITGAMAPLTALGVAAGVTTSLRLGSFVLSNDFHHPAVLAKEVATLDVLSEGRFEIGLGAVFLASDYRQAGIPFDPAGTRIRRLEETVQIMKHLFTEASVDFAGEFYTTTT